MKKPWVLLVAFSSLFVALCQSVYAEPFTIGVMPDTQCEVRGAPGMFMSQMNWLVKNRSTENIAFVVHVGDIIDWDTPDHSMWKTASEGFKLLDAAKMPYALAVGNHDGAAVKVGGSAGPGNVNANLRITDQFNTFFPVSRFIAQKGRFENGKSDNAWYTYDAGGAKWLVLTLELWARQPVVDWAKTVLTEHPEYNVLVVTHSHLNADGTIKKDNGGYGNLSPQSIFDQLISKYPNVLLVLSGHEGSSAWRTDVGAKGNKIYQILQDYQHEQNGNGYIRLLEVDTTAHKISARMYSPYLNQTRADSSTFAIEDVSFILNKAKTKH